MSLADPPVLSTLTAEDLVALPDDGIERELIRGELRARPMTLRNPEHSETEATIAYFLRDWLKRQPPPRGKVVSGEAGFRLSRDPQTFVGIDVAYVSSETARAHEGKRRFFDGPPVLAVEILSPSDRHQDVVDKVEVYLEAGTVVWVVDPHFHTVSVHQPTKPIEILNDRQELDANPYLPGFRVGVAAFFDP